MGLMGHPVFSTLSSLVELEIETKFGGPIMVIPGSNLEEFCTLKVIYSIEEKKPHL